MNNLESSLYSSSVRSYKNQTPSSNNHFVKYLHTYNFDKMPYQEQQNPHSSPIIKRNKSYNAFASKIMEKPNRDVQGLDNRFYESIEQTTSQQRYINQIKDEITRYAANEISLKTEKQLFMKQNKKLKQQISYLTEKCDGLEKKNEELFKSKSKAEILDREYHRLYEEYERVKRNSKDYRHAQDYSPLSLTHIYNLSNDPSNVFREEYRPSKLDNQLLRGKYVDSRVIPSPIDHNTQKAFGRTNTFNRQGMAVNPSPIYKIQNYRNYAGNSFEVGQLIESQIDNLNRFDEEKGQPMKKDKNQYTKVIEIKDLDIFKEHQSKFRDYQSKIRQLQMEIKQLRQKNINLYKKNEQFENQKVKYAEQINQLKYERTKIQSDLKIKNQQLNKEFNDLKIELEGGKIKVLELQQTITNSQEVIKLLTLEKEEMHKRFQLLQTKYSTEKQEKEQTLVAELKEKCEKTEKQFAKLKERWSVISQKNEENEIGKKLCQRELEEKKEVIASLEDQISRLIKQQAIKDLKQLEPMILKQQSIQSKQEGIDKSIETILNKKEMDSIFAELATLKLQYQKAIVQLNIKENDLSKLKEQNRYLNENTLKLTQLFDLQKAQNMRLLELREQWRKIQLKTRTMKQVDSATDHLWEIKEVEYTNINQILAQLKRKG